MSLLRSNGGVRGVWVLAGYTAVFAVLCGPWLLAFRQAIPTAGSPGDVRLVTWILWWVGHSLRVDPWAVFDAPINYPVANQLTGSEHFATAQLVFLPIYAATGNPALGINVVLFIAYPLAAFTMNRLLAALGFDAAVAWTIGFAFALSAVQVPADVHNLQALAFYPALVALTLRRLRDDPRPLRAAAFAAAFLFGVFASYYTAAIVLTVVLAWGAFELARPRPERMRFLVTTGSIVAVCLALLSAVSVPYFSRSEVGSPTTAIDQELTVGTVLNAYAVKERPVHFFGGVSLALGLFGLTGLLDRRWRGPSVLGLVLVVASGFILLGGNLQLLDLVGSGPVANLLATPMRFFRNVIRLSVIASLGLALLGAVALQITRRHLPRPLGTALVALVALATLYERGSILFEGELDRPAALSRDAPIYLRVKQITALHGSGPLLEFPLGAGGFPLQADVMLGSVWHELPLITGFTGYYPRQRSLIDETIRRLPSPEAVQDLVDMTHLRWILLRPGAFWGSHSARARFARDLLRIPGVGPEYRLGEWSLIPIEGKIVHHDWFDAIARGTGADRSLLGTPLADVAPERTASRIELRGDAAAVVPAEVGTPLVLGVQVVNLGQTTWPVVRDGKRASPGGMSLRARWESLDPRHAPSPSEVSGLPLSRDVPPGEAIAIRVRVPPPEQPGRYALELSLEQLDRAPLPPNENPPLALSVAVAPAKPLHRMPQRPPEDEERPATSPATS